MKPLQLDILRKHQIKPINSVLDGHDTLVIAPTGSGKSAIFQVSAIVGAAKGKWTLVFEPTVSLIADQVNRLRDLGIAAEMLTSRNKKQHNTILKQLRQSKLAMLYITPERLQSHSFLEAVKKNPPWLVVVDEAHCVLDWGYTFRSDYLKIKAFIDHITKTEIGIHTISLYAGNLKYHEIQRAIDRQMEKRKIQVRKKDPYNIDRSLKDIYFLNEGITLWIYQSHDKSSGISFVVNPSTLQKGEYQPAKLWKPTKKACKSMITGLKKCIDALGLECTADDLSLSQMDLTMNLWLDDEADMDEIIRLFQKCKLPRHFKRVHLKDKKADRHYFGIRTNDVLVKVYDKIFELHYNDRCPSKFAEKNLLRIEVSLKREAFLEKLSLERGDNLYDMLEAGYGQAKSVIEGYLHKMFPCSGEFVSYKQAKRAIETGVKNQKLQEQMLYLLKKTSRSAGLDTAVQMLRDHYKHVNHQRIKKLFAEFEKLRINREYPPICVNLRSGVE